MRVCNDRIVDLANELNDACIADNWVLELTVCESEQYQLKRREWAWTPFHFFSGLYHGIPLCCVLYWLRNYGELVKKSRVQGNLPMGYIRCDKCERKGK